MRTSIALAVALAVAAPMAEAQKGVCFYGASTTVPSPVPTIFARFSWSIAGEETKTFRMMGHLGAIPGPYADCGAFGGICMPDEPDYVYGMRLIPFIDYTLIAPPFPATYWGSFESVGGVFYTPTLEQRKPGQIGQQYKVMGYYASCSIGKRFVAPL